MIVFATKETLDHIAERHGPRGSGDANFDANFLYHAQGYGKIMKEVLDKGASSAEYDSSGRLVYRYYYNFNTKTGIGRDGEGTSVTYKGVEMVGTAGTNIFTVETMFPKGILKT